MLRRIISGVGNILRGREKIVIGEDEILTILPHRERMLLLNEVVITNKSLSGEFSVTEEVCEGHQFNGKLVFRGVDTIDMAAQVLGVWASQYPQMAGRLAFFRRSGGSKFINVISPFDLLVMETKIITTEGEENPKFEISGRPGLEITRIIAHNFVARVGKIRMAEVSSIELVVIDSESLA